MNLHLRFVFLASMSALMVMLPSCVNKNPGEPMKMSASADENYDNGDPIEGINRGIFRFNEVLDGVIIKPMAHIYRGVFPQEAQKGIKNALTNLNAPVVFVNSVLQADATNAERTFGRFVVNSTVGIVGLFDVASSIGIPKEHKKDFGQTLGVYGVGPGPYVMLPILGPSSLRDSLGLVADVADDPFTYIFTTTETVARDVTRTVVTRADYIPFTDRVYNTSLDPYATFRSIYLQHRAKIVRDYLNRDAGELEKEKTGK